MTTMIRSALFSLLLSACVSCSFQPKPGIVGKWQSLGQVGKGDIMDFSVEGNWVRTYLSEDGGAAVKGSTMRGRYRFVDSSHFELESDFVNDKPIKAMKNVKIDPMVLNKWLR
jgi:hypothetical protein